MASNPEAIRRTLGGGGGGGVTPTNSLWFQLVFVDVHGPTLLVPWTKFLSNAKKIINVVT